MTTDDGGPGVLGRDIYLYGWFNTRHSHRVNQIMIGRRDEDMMAVQGIWSGSGSCPRASKGEGEGESKSGCLRNRRKGLCLFDVCIFGVTSDGCPFYYLLFGSVFWRQDGEGLGLECQGRR